MKKRVAVLLLILWLVWRGVLSGVRTAQELSEVEGAELGQAFSWNEQQRIERELADWEGRFGLQEGREFALYKALRQSVPPDSSLHVSADREMASKLAYTHLAVLLYPTRLFPLVQIPHNWREGVQGWGPRDFLLEHHRFTQEPLEERFELLDEAPDFRLWRFVGAGQ